jgi:putative membrane protein
MRRVALCSGLFIAWAATCSPWAHADHPLLTAHMVSHLLLTTVAAPLILLGGRDGAHTDHPISCWLASTVTVIFWHIPSVFQAALDSHIWHMTEQASFLVSGLLFWLPVVHAKPGSGWAVPLYLFLATLPCDILSAFLVFRGHVVYPAYAAICGATSLTPAQDQELAGALMWVWVTFAYCAPALAATLKMLSPQAERS